MFFRNQPRSRFTKVAFSHLIGSQIRRSCHLQAPIKLPLLMLSKWPEFRPFIPEILFRPPLIPMATRFYLLIKMDKSECGTGGSHQDQPKLTRLTPNGPAVSVSEFLPTFSHQDLMTTLLKYGTVAADFLSKTFTVKRKKFSQSSGWTAVAQ